jgi:Uma2 family endonuclease
VVSTAEVTGDWRGVKHLCLVIEVVSRSSARGDRLVKRRAYQEAGVDTYWVVDPDRRVVEVWHPGDELPELVTGLLTWRLALDAPELKINLPELFTSLPGLPSE